MPTYIRITSTTSGSVITGYHAYTESYTHYYPFGMVMPGRSYNSGEYRYGFNGQEKDDEVKGNGNSYDFGARLYDPRLGRWMKVDPYYNVYPAYSPFCYGVNNPVNIIDRDGNTIVPFDEFSRDQMRQHFVRVFNAATAKLLTENLSMDGTQKNINKKEFRQAIKGMSSEQKALARGYYHAINSPKKMLVAFGNNDETIPDAAIVRKGYEKYRGMTYGEINKQFNAATFISDGSVKTEYSAVVVMPAEFESKPLAVLDENGYSGQYQKVNGNIDLVPNQTTDGNLDESIVHEVIGHGLLEGLLGKKGHMAENVAPIQVENLLRKQNGKQPRSGIGHNVSQGMQGNKGYPKSDVTGTPAELQTEDIK
ncbi:MAG: RHS repeat-associated core domain-containing protein [Chitinophagales bacterium]|nr:RHS repeat-associated core domain-containing protein [Chitinophagales bacterium]